MLKNIIVQGLIVLLVVNLISFIRETQLLGYNEPMPSFELPTLDGEFVNNQQLEGKPTLIYFWAPWCKVCDVSLPNLQDFYRDNGAKINVISVVLSYEDIDNVDMMVVKHKLDFPVLIGSNETAKAFNITGFPTYYLIDSEQTIAAKSLGYSSEVGMKLRALLL